jgi:hypothetical protein
MSDAEAFRAKVLAAQASHDAEAAASAEADPDWLDLNPRCAVCGEGSGDTNQAVGLFDPECGGYVAVVHWEGCREQVRQHLPSWTSDFDQPERSTV